MKYPSIVLIDPFYVSGGISRPASGTFIVANSDLTTVLLKATELITLTSYFTP
jgi:hypothetical protein